MTLPLRRMTLHFSHIGFTDGLTFILFFLLYVPLYVVRAEERMSALRRWFHRLVDILIVYHFRALTQEFLCNS